MKESISTVIKQAVILAGGRGERLRPLTDNLPKPMAPIGGQYPFLDYLLATIKEAGIERVLILVGYKAETIMDRYQDGTAFGLHIDYSVGAIEDLTGRRILNAYSQLDEEFLLMYGDNYWPIEIDGMMAHYHHKRLPAMTTVFNNTNGSAEYGFENNTQVMGGIVKRYDKSRHSMGLNGVDIGYFILKKEILDTTITANISFEESILAKLAQEQLLAAYVTNSQYYYITSLTTLGAFEEAVKKYKFQPI